MINKPTVLEGTLQGFGDSRYGLFTLLTHERWYILEDDAAKLQKEFYEQLKMIVDPLFNPILYHMPSIPLGEEGFITAVRACDFEEYAAAHKTLEGLVIAKKGEFRDCDADGLSSIEVLIAFLAGVAHCRKSHGLVAGLPRHD